MYFKMRITLEDFLVTGTLGQIRLGMSMSEVSEWLGDNGNLNLATPRKGVKQARFTTWPYGCLQLGFLWKRLILIGFYFRRTTRLPKQLVIEGYFPSKASTLAEVQRYLAEQSINFQIDPTYTTTS